MSTAVNTEMQTNSLVSLSINWSWVFPWYGLVVNKDNRLYVVEVKILQAEGHVLDVFA